MKPTWLHHLDEGRVGRTRGFVLTGNTCDKVYYAESGIAPIPLKYFLAAYLAREGYTIGTYSLANGFEELRPPATEKNAATRRSPFSSLPNNLSPDQVLAHMTPWLRAHDTPVALILDYSDHMAPASGGMNAVVGQMHLAMLEVLHNWGLDENIRSTRNLVLLVSHENQLNDLLLQGGVGYKQLSIALPSEPERRAFVDWLLQAGQQPEAHDELFGDVPPTELGRVTSGLPLVEIEELLHYASTKGAQLDRALIRERKSAVIGQLCRGLLEVHEPTIGFDAVSGLAHAKEELSRIIQAIRHDPATATPGILFVGVPGCGKSFLVHALARELGYPCLAMRNVREGLVGASERNLDRVLWVAETLAPCVMWIDELDQQMGQRNTGQSMDAGTSERMMGRIWEFMGSLTHRGRILWIGTSNRPDILDPALLDRFPLVIPFLHPTPCEVEALLPQLAGQVGRVLASDVRGREIAQLPSLRRPTVRALQEIVARAGTLTDVDASAFGSPIDHAHLSEAAADYKPNYNPLHHQFIGMKAVQMATFGSVLPWRDRRGLRPGSEIPDYLTDVVDSATGVVDDEQLSRKLDLLAGALRSEARGRQF
jgi:DNA polymerase III delta prime subunit